MTIQKLASEIAKREGLKVEIGIGQVREVLRILIDLETEAISRVKTGEVVADVEFPLHALVLAAEKKTDPKPRRKK